MAKIHHTQLKSAVAKYGPLHAEGKTEEEVKIEIAKDEKGFDEEAVDAIYAAIVDGPASEEKGSYVVAKSFRDKNDFSIQYQEGDDASSFDSERLKRLVALGLVEKK